MNVKILINLTAYMLLSSPVYGKCISNISNTLHKLSQTQPNNINLYIDDSITYTLNPLNFFGIHNHFQGVYRTEKNIYISGGNKKDHLAEIFMFKKTKDKYSFIDKVIVNNNDNKHWHAGSFQLYQDHLIIPVERLDEPLTSKIIKLRLTDKKIINFLDVDYNKTGAIDYFNYKDKTYFALFDPKEISIFTEDLNLVKRIEIELFTGSGAKVLTDCNENIYFANITNNGAFPPIINGKNVIELYSFNLNNFNVNHIDKYEFNCKSCNFRGAANIIQTKNTIEVQATSMYKSLISKEIMLEYFSINI